MEDKFFDKDIKEKLEQVQAPYQAAHWQRMSERLDATEFRPETDTRFDQLAKDKLSNPTELPYAAASWEKLAMRMDRSRTLIQRLRTSKVAELAILILALLNLDAFETDSKWQYPPTPQQITTHQPNSVDTELNKQEQTAAKSHPLPSAAGAELPRSQNRKAADTRTRVQRNGSNYRTKSQPIVAAEQVPAPAPGLIETINGLVYSLPESGPTLSTSETDVVLTSTANTQSIELLPAVAITYLPEEAIVPTLSVVPMVKPARQRAGWEVIAHAGPDYVSVHGLNNTTTRGYTGGVHIARIKGKWSVQTGVDYTRVAYRLKPMREIVAGTIATGQIGRVATAVDLDVVSVPVRVGRSIWKRKRTEISVAAGPQLIATTGVSADYNHFFTPGSMPDPTAIPAYRVPAAPPINGIFEGGKLDENLHLAAQVALRADLKLGSTNKSLFAEVNGQALITRNRLAKSPDYFSGVGLRTGLIAAL